MISSVNGAAASGETPQSSIGATAKQTEVTKDAFLQLLVAQVKNQDPLNPADGTQFLSQLAQFSELEQMIGMRSELGDIAAQLRPAAESAGTTDSTSSPAENGSGTQQTKGAEIV